MNYKHVLCVYPHMKGAPEKKYFPPIGLEYIATALEDLVETVTLLDMRFETQVDDMIKDKNRLALFIRKLGLPTKSRVECYRPYALSNRNCHGR
jgi:hypothetical protein